MPAKEPNLVVFLGAGASAADGAPLQREILSAYFDIVRHRRGCSEERDAEIDTFLTFVFGLDARDANAADFPAFEEVFALLDGAMSDGRAYPDFDNDNHVGNSGRVRRLRFHLMLALAEVLDHRLRSPSVNHTVLVDRLAASGLLSGTSFVTTNYDILCDNALLGHADLTPPHVESKGVRYGFEYRIGSFTQGRLESGDTRPLMKLHGSLNWLHCPSCGRIVVTPFEKGAARLYQQPDVALCRRCDVLSNPVIVPPSFFKDVSVPCLQGAWRAAEEALSNANVVVFCGYSFPDADFHVKTLIKRSQVIAAKQGIQQQFILCNAHAAKTTPERDGEYARYRRFLGPNVVDANHSFEQFAQNPQRILIGNRLPFRFDGRGGPE